jgi:putative peptidoglycan lipid II flippase
MGVVVFWLAGEQAAWLQAETFTRVWRLAAVIAAGMAVYAIVLRGCGFRLRQLKAPEVFRP